MAGVEEHEAFRERSAMTSAIWDAHAHFVPRKVVDAAEAGRFGMRVEQGRLVAPGGELPLSKLTDTDALLRWMDARSIQGVVLSVPPLLYRYDLDESEAAKWTRMVNDGLQDVVREAPDRLRYLAHLPLQAPELATAEVEGEDSRARAGFCIGSSVEGLTLDDSSLQPVFQSLDLADRFVLVHPVEAPDPRLERYYLGNLLGNPYETSLAAACLIFSGMLSRYENLRLCLAHAGGAAPYLIGRWQRGYDTGRPGIPRLSMQPRGALRRLWFDSVAHSEEALALLVREVGEDRVLLGSDYPFPMREDDPLATLGTLPEGARRAISRCNHVLALDNTTEVAS